MGRRGWSPQILANLLPHTKLHWWEGSTPTVLELILGSAHQPQALSDLLHFYLIPSKCRGDGVLTRVCWGMAYPNVWMVSYARSWFPYHKLPWELTFSWVPNSKQMLDWIFCIAQLLVLMFSVNRELSKFDCCSKVICVCIKAYAMTRFLLHFQWEQTILGVWCPLQNFLWARCWWCILSGQ